MAILNTFLSLHTDGAGGTLRVRGKTVDEDGKLVELGDDARIVIAVIRVGQLFNRTQLEVEEPATNPWTATTGAHHFNDGDEVYAIGAMTQAPGDGIDLFVGEFTVA